MKFKHEILNAIARRYGYTSYLEICTHYTGGSYHRIDGEQLTRRKRLMYGCAPDHDDGSPIDLRTEAESGEGLFARLLQSGERFELIFVDPDHTYASSSRDLVFALQLLAPGGTIMIHDCNPGSPELARPEYQTGDWCGVTYAAYLDVALGTEGYSYVTVDTDWGCGILSQDDRWKRFSKSRIERAVIDGWYSTPLPDKYHYLDQHRDDLLRLISRARFERRLARPESGGWSRIWKKAPTRAGRAS